MPRLDRPVDDVPVPVSLRFRKRHQNGEVEHQQVFESTIRRLSPLASTAAPSPRIPPNRMAIAAVRFGDDVVDTPSNCAASTTLVSSTESGGAAANVPCAVMMRVSSACNEACCAIVTGFVSGSPLSASS